MPAVDVLDGRAVRLERGDFDAVTREAGDPVELVRRFAAAGPPLLHVVVLDAARRGGVPLELAGRLAEAAAPVPLQLGGGVRSPEDALALAAAGVARVIVGTAVFEQGPEPYVGALGDRLVAAVDVRDGVVRTHGWERSGGLAVDEAVDLCRDAGRRATALHRRRPRRDARRAGPRAARACRAPLRRARARRRRRPLAGRPRRARRARARGRRRRQGAARRLAVGPARSPRTRTAARDRGACRRRTRGSRRRRRTPTRASRRRR